MTDTHSHYRRRSMHTAKARGLVSIRAAAAFLLLALSTSGGMAQASGPAPAVSPAIYEPEFLRMMIDHHGMAVEMAELCPGRTAHAEVLDTCTSIVATQKQEIKKMKSWLSNWYGIAYKPQMMPHEMADLDRLATMNGADFEKDFLLSMTTHHMAAIQNAAECLARAYHYQLIDECEAIVTSQALEMATMRGWLARWYGIRALNFMRSAVIGPANRPHG